MPTQDGLRLNVRQIEDLACQTHESKAISQNHTLSLSEKSNTNVVMMQAAEDGPCFDAPAGVNWSPRRRILVQGQVRSAV
jgi:hypothetical protein